MMIGDRIQKLRENKNLSQKQLADLVGVKTGLIAEWESGESIPSSEQLQFLSLLFKEQITSDDKDSSILDKSLDINNDVSTNTSKDKNRKKIFIVGLCIGLLLVVGLISIVLISINKGVTNNKNVIEQSRIINFSDNPDAIELVEKSVVKINCYGENRKLIATGSGFIAFENNVVITNYHVIEESFRVEAIDNKGKVYDIGSVLAYDSDKDVAILKVSANIDVQPLSICDDSNIKKGEKVIAIGSPIGIQNSVSAGIYSGSILNGEIEMIQFTAPISPGSSGGPLFNNNGEVIGITTGSYESGQNINVAIPSSVFLQVYNNRTVEITLEDLYEKEVSPFQQILKRLTREPIMTDIDTILNKRDLLVKGEYYLVKAYVSRAYDNGDDDYTVSFSNIDMIGKDKNNISVIMGNILQGDIEDGFLYCKMPESEAILFNTKDECMLLICKGTLNNSYDIVAVQNNINGSVYIR